MKIAVINGVNLNMLGIREKNVYGESTYEELVKGIEKFVAVNFKGVQLDFFQSNIEGEIVGKIHSCKDYDGIVLNAGAFTHYSYAILDAIKCVSAAPVIEVHLSNIAAREEFRRNSVIAPACAGSIAGLGADVYKLAITYFCAMMPKKA